MSHYCPDLIHIFWNAGLSQDALSQGSEVIIMQNPDRCFDDYNVAEYYRIINNIQRAGITTVIFSNNPDTLYGVLR